MRTKTLVLALTLAIALADSARSDDTLSKGHAMGQLPPYHVTDPNAPAITEKNLLESDRFWPYQTALVKAWQSLPVGSLGILIRVESETLARVDFGRDGLHEIPVKSTDLVLRSNAIRLGKVEKFAANFLMAIGPRLLDPSAPEDVRPYPFEDAARNHLFLCVFADPWRKDFGPLVTALTPLRARAGVQTILFPLSHRPDLQVRGQLRAMNWTPPYVYAHLSEPYTRTLLDEKTAFPAIQLQTRDGRVLYEGRFSSDVVAKLEAVLEKASNAGE